LYRDQKVDIISYLQADYLNTNDYVRDESTISVWDKREGSYKFGFNVFKDVKIFAETCHKDSSLII